MFAVSRTTHRNRPCRRQTTAGGPAWFPGPAAALLPVLLAVSAAGASPAAAAAATSSYLARGDAAMEKGLKGLARRLWRRAAGEATADTADARSRLLELNRTDVYPGWVHSRSENFRLIAAPGSRPARQPAAFLASREQTYEDLVERLQQQPAGPITLVVYRSSRQGQKLLGRPLAYASPAEREIHIREDQEPGHEEAHVIAWAWNRRGAGETFLEEGLAVALSSHPGSPHATAAEALSRGVLPDLTDLVERFHDHRQGYALAGSFVGHLIEIAGIDTVRELYTADPGDFLGHLSRLTGRHLSRLQASWEAALAAQGTASREPILKALALLRLNRTDDALARLRDLEAADPENAAVAYALAHALQETGDAAGSTAAYRHLLELHLPYHLSWMRQRALQALDHAGAPASATTP